MVGLDRCPLFRVPLAKLLEDAFILRQHAWRLLLAGTHRLLLNMLIDNLCRISLHCKAVGIDRTGGKDLLMLLARLHILL